MNVVDMGLIKSRLKQNNVKTVMYQARPQTFAHEIEHLYIYAVNWEDRWDTEHMFLGFLE